jgi:hypothetical protein
MPGTGFSTIGLKSDLMERLQSITNTFYPGMFLPSTLIIMMNEVKRGYYSVSSHNIKLNLSGRYNSITIRLDVADWLKENYTELKEEYEQKYHAKCRSVFMSYFLANLIESKFDNQNNMINLKGSDFKWLQKEYLKFKADSKLEYQIPTFEKFADVYLNELLKKIEAAQEILTLTNFSSKLEFENFKKI